MTQIKTKTIYETSDGKEFSSKDTAIVHERTLQIKKIIEDSGVGSGGSWSPSMILDWLIENAETIGQPLYDIAFLRKAKREGQSS